MFPTKILLATDGSEEADSATRTAVGLARSTGSELHVIYVLPGYVGIPSAVEVLQREPLEQAKRHAEEFVARQVDRIKAAGGSVARSYLKVGKADEEIVALAEEVRAGLVMVGSRGRGRLRRAVMGSVSDSVVRHAHCPVLVVRGEPSPSPGRILLATDGSEDAELAAGAAIELANKTGSELHVVYVGEFEPIPLAYPKDKIERAMKSLARESRSLMAERIVLIAEAGGEVSGDHVRVGHPAEEIVALAEKIDAGLVVVGSRGLSRLRRALMGGVSDSIVRHAHCPVLVVRLEEKAT